MSTQVPLQLVSVAWQESWHAPDEQTWPAPQVLPHMPQFWRSVWVLAQTPPQSVNPDWQLTRHVPFEHNCPEGQATPHAPQF